MNKALQNALEQLKGSIREKRGVAIFPYEAQALLDERTALRDVCKALSAWFDQAGVPMRGYNPIVERARVAIAKSSDNV